MLHEPESSIVIANGAWVLGPNMQRLLVEADTELGTAPNSERFEKDWTEADFCDWVERTTWTFAKTCAETSPHEYAVLGKPNTELM